MAATPDEQAGFAPDDDAPIGYMARTRAYYAAIGYTTPYRWAHYVDAPFQPLRQAAVALARRHRHHRGAVRSEQGRPGPRRALQWRRQVLSGLLRRYVRRRTICASRMSPMTACTPRPTTATPGFRCRNCSGSRASGGSARSHRASSARRPIAAIASRSRPMRRRSSARCRADGVDAAVLVPNCPVCHQTVSLVARHLEANGIATVVMGCAKDIVEHAACRASCSAIFRSAMRPADRMTRPRRP